MTLYGSSLLTSVNSVHTFRAHSQVLRGQRIGVSGTPTIVVQGQMLRAAPTLETLEKMMAAEVPAPKRVSAVSSAAASRRNRAIANP